MLSSDMNEFAEDDVYSGGEKYGRDDNEEVLNYKEYDVIGIPLGREDAKRVADDLHRSANKEGREEPRSISK